MQTQTRQETNKLQILAILFRELDQSAECWMERQIHRAELHKPVPFIRKL